MTGQILGYVRVSSTDQNPARQVEAIGAVDGTFTDHLPGASCSERAALISLMRHARAGDTVRGPRWTAWPAPWSTWPPSSPS